jgi:pimeloyl-ACP methyl ester carboxylesterase
MAQAGAAPKYLTTDLEKNPKAPGGLAELTIPSHGSRMAAFMYKASGTQPHPTLILLHGFPGNERNGDLAQALRRAGMNALVYSYRGAWGNAGTFSFGHALEDVASAIDFVRSDSSVAAFGIDRQRVILLGHSMGGWLALMGAAAAGESVACTVALDFWNVGADGRRMRGDPGRDTSLASYVRSVTDSGGPLRVENGSRGLIAEMGEHAGEWDVERKAGSLAAQPMLLIAAANTEAHSKLAAALELAHARRVTALQWKTDHSFSDRRILLAKTIVNWLDRNCKPVREEAGTRGSGELRLSP